VEIEAGEEAVMTIMTWSDTGGGRELRAELKRTAPEAELMKARSSRTRVANCRI
jgi:hypothetical protein